MLFQQLKTEIKDIGFEQVRKDNEDYLEAVILKSGLPQLTTRLERFFGSLAWPSKTSLSSQAKEVIEDFGGLRHGQALYFKQQDNQATFAMLWPWNDGEHLTLKVGQKIFVADKVEENSE